MRILCLWSGGLDSTYMLKKLSKEGHQVTAGWVKIKNNKEKNLREEKAREAIIDTGFLNKYDIIYDSKPLSEFSLGFRNQQLMFHQVTPWLIGLIDRASGDDFDAVAIGYVRNDDAISFLDEIRAIYESFNAISHKPLPQLLFPLSKIDKNHIFHELEANVRTLVTWCENYHSSDDNCGQCTPCRRAAYHGIYNNNPSSKPIADKEEPDLSDDLLTPVPFDESNLIKEMKSDELSEEPPVIVDTKAEVPPTDGALLKHQEVPDKLVMIRPDATKEETPKLVKTVSLLSSGAVVKRTIRQS